MAKITVKNHFEILSDNLAILVVENENGDKYEAKISPEDIEILNKYKWLIDIYGKNKRRLVSHIKTEGNKNKKIRIKNVLIDFQENITLKHKNGDSLDFRRENLMKSNLYRSNYKISQDETYAIIFSNKNEEFLIDIEDLDFVINHMWSVCSVGYPRARINNKEIRIHRFILQHHENIQNKVIDHINHNKYDNRKSNLRICTQKENGKNISLAVHNTSGKTGVSWNKNAEKWQVSIQVNGNQLHLGLFDKYEEALKVRSEAEDKYFGEFSYKNSMALTNHY